MAKDIGSYFLEQGQPIVPKAKPKQYTIAKEKSQTEEVLDILNTKAAATMLSPRTYVNLVGQTARKAYDQQDISASDYYDIVMPLFGETGEMVTEKIRQYDSELNRYADGGRIGYKDGSKFKIQASGSKTGKQQIQGAPEGITSDKEIINAILTMDIPLTDKVNLIGDMQYGKFRDKIEYKDNEIFLDDPKSYRDKNIGLDYNRDGEGFSGSATVGDRGPAFNIKFKKSFEDGGRVNFDEGSPGKKGSNQYTANMRTAEEIQKAINKAPPKIINGKVYPLTKKDLRGEGKYYTNKIAGRKELERFKDVLKIPSEGKPITKDTRGDQNLKASQFNKSAQGASISMDKINNFAHFAPKLKTFLTSTQDTGPLKANVNRAAEGYDKIAKKIALKQEKLIQEKPKNWRLKLDAANAEARKASIEANKTLGKENKNLKGTLGYFVVNPNTGEFKLKGVDRAKTFAGISGERQEYKKMDPSKRAAFGPTQSKIQGIIDLVKSKVKGADAKRASNAPIPPKTLKANMFKGAFKGLPGKSGEIKDPLGGPDLIDFKKIIRKPYND